MTPHHKTGARLVAQSNVNRLMTQRITRTGIGARRTSVRLRKGRAARSLVSKRSLRVPEDRGQRMRRTVEAQEDDDKVVTQGEEEHGVSEKV